MKTPHGTATGRVPQDEQFAAWLVETGRALREHGLAPSLTVAHADWFRRCFDEGLPPEATAHRAAGAHLD